MRFESLPNELLLDLFEFLKGVYLLRAFHRLNSRFDNLLFTHFQSKSLDFQFVSKTDFDLICQRYLPTMANEIVSLRLADDDETPQQTEYFLSHNLAVGQFIHLQALSLNRIRSQQIMDTIIHELYDLPHLQRLTFSNCDFRSAYIDCIWSLSKLTYLTLDTIFSIDWSITPTVTSLSQENLSILHTSCEGDYLKRLLEHTSCLKRLSIGLIDGCFSQQLPLMIPSLEVIDLGFNDLTYGLDNLVQCMPNLRKVTVSAMCTYVDGYRWEKLITDYLPKLEIFRLMMRFRSDDDIVNEEQVDRILDSFRTHFWIEEHRWFVRCRWNPNLNFYCVYTLPYPLHSFVPDTAMKFKSTCLNDDDFYSYDRVHQLSYDCYSSTDFFHLRFSNLHHIFLILPRQDNFPFVLPTLNRLTSLSVSLRDSDIARSQLQALLDNASILHSLKLYSISHVSLVDMKSTSIRRLNVSSRYPCFNEQTCAALCNSSLGIQCEVLFIQVEDRRNILYLVNNMKNLRALRVHCKEDSSVHQHHSDPSVSKEDEIVEWLRQHLSSACLILGGKFCIFRLWIR